VHGRIAGVSVLLRDARRGTRIPNNTLVRGLHARAECGVCKIFSGGFNISNNAARYEIYTITFVRFRVSFPRHRSRNQQRNSAFQQSTLRGKLKQNE
jgi:hypothetical protein